MTTGNTPDNSTPDNSAPISVEPMEQLGQEPLVDASAEPRPLTAVQPTAIRQGYGLDRIYEVAGRRVRVEINRNAYDFQSIYRTSVWTDSGWQVAVRIAPESPEMRALPSYVCWTDTPSDGRQRCIDAVERVAARLLHETAVLLR